MHQNISSDEEIQEEENRASLQKISFLLEAMKDHLDIHNAYQKELTRTFSCFQKDLENINKGEK